MSGRKTKRGKALDIPQRVKQEVWERDGGACVLCGSRESCMPNAHFIRRSQGGLGIPENIVTLCTNFGNSCHAKYDGGSRAEREAIRGKLRDYLLRKYPGWDESKLIYKRWD